jgi:hypothetical protein
LAGCPSQELVSLDQAPIKENLKRISVKVKEYCPTAGAQYKDFYGIQMTYEWDHAQLQQDFDKDGIPNLLEMKSELELSYKDRDSAKTGLGDLVIFLSGIAPDSQKNIRSCSSGTQATSTDGLSDCQKLFLGLDPKKWDNDGDSIPDYLEVRYGLNPTDPYDGTLDSDGDGRDNFTEIKLNLPLNETNTTDIEDFAFKYTNDTQTISGQECTDFTVSNITIVEVSSGNLLRLYLVEGSRSGTKTLRTHEVVVPRSVENGEVIEIPYSSF